MVLGSGGGGHTRDRHMMTLINECIRYDLMTTLSDRPKAMMAKTRLKEPSASLATANGLLVLNGSALGSSTGWNCCWAGRLLTGWAGELRRAAAGFSGPLGWVLEGLSMGEWRRARKRERERERRGHGYENGGWTSRYREVW